LATLISSPSIRTFLANCSQLPEQPDGGCGRSSDHDGEEPVPAEEEQQRHDDQNGRDQADPSQEPTARLPPPADAHRVTCLSAFMDDISARSPAGVQHAHVFDRFRTGPGATAVGALLLIIGGAIVVAHGGFVGTIVAAIGGIIVVRERIRSRR
jgi:hypothetical protein